MALFHTTVVDNQIKALDTIGTVSGSIATFDTDRAERLVSCVCEVASGSESVSVFVNSVNVWNEQWESGYIDSSGNNVASNNYIRSKGFIRIKPNTNYYIKTPATLKFIGYDANKNFIRSIDYTWGNEIINASYFSGISYVRFYNAGSGSITTYNNDICLNISDDNINGTYYSFSGVIIDLGETLSGDGTFDVLSGILTRSDDTTKQLDANYIQTNNGINNVYCDTGDTEVNYIMTVGNAIS